MPASTLTNYTLKLNKCKLITCRERETSQTLSKRTGVALSSLYKAYKASIHDKKVLPLSPVPKMSA